MSETLISLGNLKKYNEVLDEKKQDKLTAGSNIKIENGVISMVNGSVSIGNTPGDDSSVWIDTSEDYDTPYLTEESDPTVSAWAKSSTKPTYTADEVGAIDEDDEYPNSEIDLMFEGIFNTQKSN